MRKMFEQDIDNGQNKKKEEEKEDIIKDNKGSLININNHKNMSEKLVLIILKHAEKLNIDKLKSQIMNRKFDEQNKTKLNKSARAKPLFLLRNSSQAR